MDRKVASVLSYLFHPLIMPTLLYGFFYLFLPFLLAPYNFPQFLLIILISTFLIPGISVLTLYKSGTIKSLVMNEASERAIPYTFTSVFYWIITYLFYTQFRENLFIIVVILSITATLTFISIINFFWKISAHSAAIAGVIGILFVANIKYPEVHLTYPILCTVILAGMIMSGRLALQVHSLAQIAAGALLGFVLNFLMLFFLT